MDRQIVYVGQIPLETDLLNAQKNAMIGLAKLAEVVLGSGGVYGLSVSQTGTPSMQVLVAPGQIYDFKPADATAFSSLGTDSHSILKQGLLLDAVTLALTAPPTSGQSVNYLVQAQYQDIDDSTLVLPYFNSANPTVAFSGAGNSGVAQNTVRQGVCTITAKAGAAATTGSQTTPSPDTGCIGLAVITVAHGQTTITNSNIVVYSGIVKAGGFGAGSDALLISNSGLGDTTITLVAANDPSARPTLCVKADYSGHVCNFVDPTNGFVWTVDVQYQCARLIPIPSLNIWIKQE